MTVDAQDTATPGKKRRRPELDSVAKVRRETARIYRAALNNEMPLKDATRFVFILIALSRMLADQTLEARIEALEQQAVSPALEYQPIQEEYTT